MFNQATHIELSESNLIEIPPVVFTKRKLNWLSLSNNQIVRVPKEISKLKYLSRLALNDNKVECIDRNIGEITSLAWMDLTRNRLRTLPQEFGRLVNLTGLGLSENEFEEIPECVYKLIALRKFGCFGNRITRLSPMVKNWKSLLKMDLSNNGITEIPEEICELKNLTWLNLTNNRLKRLPMKLNKLRNLEELGLGCNLLEEMPNVSGLKKLRILPVFKNKIKYIEGLSTLENLEKLDVSDNLYEKFPSEVIRLRFLKYLNLKNNMLAEIQLESIENGAVSSINMVDISDNKIKYLPYRFFKVFSNITTFRISNNPFSAQPHVTPNSLPDLMQLSYGKLMNYNRPSPITWVNTLLGKCDYVCDSCGYIFVTDPFIGYNNSTLSDNMMFVMQKTMCSKACYAAEYLKDAS